MPGNLQNPFPSTVTYCPIKPESIPDIFTLSTPTLNYLESSLDLFLKEPFACRTEYLDRLVSEGDSIDLTLSYSRGPFREAYYVHSVLRAEPRRAAYRSPTRLIELPYRHGAGVGY